MAAAGEEESDSAEAVSRSQEVAFVELAAAVHNWGRQHRRNPSPPLLPYPPGYACAGASLY